MEHIDLQNLIEYLLNLNVEYRKLLDLDNSLVFGMDLEYICKNIKEIEKTVKDINNTYYMHSDKFKLIYNHVLFNILRQDNYVSLNTPVFTDSNIFYESLKDMLFELDNSCVEISNNKGLHIHTDLSYFEEDTNLLHLFLKLFTVYENVLYRFGYGDADFSSNNTMLFSKPSSNLLHEYLSRKNLSTDYYQNINELKKILICKGYSINFHEIDKNVKNETIEFRFFNNTFNPIIIQNYISLIGNLFSSIKGNDIDIELLDYKFENYDKLLYSIENYSNVDSVNALEFADTIFNNSVDKDYFLKQYFIKEKIKTKKLVS